MTSLHHSKTATSSWTKVLVSMHCFQNTRPHHHTHPIPNLAFWIHAPQNQIHSIIYWISMQLSKQQLSSKS